MRILAISILSLTVHFIGCKSREERIDSIIPDNVTEKFYWSTFETETDTFYTVMFLPLNLDNVTKTYYAQLDIASNYTILYQRNLQSITAYNYLHFDSLADATNAYPLFGINGVEVNIGKLKFGKRNIRGYKNFGEPIISNKNDLAEENCIGTVGANIFLNKLLIINFPDQTISVLDSSNADLENYFSFEECKIIDSSILVPIVVNEKTLYFMYDTGSSLFPMITSLSKWKEITTQKINDTIPVTNWRNPVTMLGSYSSKKIKIGINSLTNFKVYYTLDNYFDFQRMYCDGIIGNALFLNKTICIDYKTKRFGIAK